VIRKDNAYSNVYACLLTQLWICCPIIKQTFYLTNFNTFVQMGMQEFPNFVATNIFVKNAAIQSKYLSYAK